MTSGPTSRSDAAAAPSRTPELSVLIVNYNTSVSYTHLTLPTKA